MPTDIAQAARASDSRRVRAWSNGSRMRRLAYEGGKFALKQARACVFGALMLGLILVTHFLYPPDAALSRYDFLTLTALGIQVALLALKIERLDEALMILVFHGLGTAMEVFKTAHGSWIYPELGYLRIGGVPLFSGFMYASVGSYIVRAWRLFDFRFTRYPPAWPAWTLAVAAYANFFGHHYGPDLRWGLFAASALLFGRTWIEFRPDRAWRRMPLLLGFVLVALFIWLAENLGTFGSAWTYPDQRHGWTMVPIGKIGAWYLLMLLSFVLVTAVRPPVSGAWRRPGSGPAGPGRS